MFRFVLLLCCVLVLSNGEGYWDIQLSPQSISSVPFGSGHISIWEHSVTKGRYYAMPLVYLQQDTARTVENIVTGEHELNFDVLMWTVEAKESVYRHLKTNVNSSIRQDQIGLLPMEKIRIVWRDRVRPIARYFKLVEHWKSNTHLPSTVSFQFTCVDREKCEQLKNAMKLTPLMFNALELEYVINGQRSARRVLTVTGSQMSQGRLFTKLQNMPNADKSGKRYLKSDDLKTVTNEAVTNVIASIVTDSDYVDTGDEVGMKDVLQHTLERNEVNTQNFEPHKWNSVFWDPTWARPDKITNYLNKVLSKDTSDSRNFLLNENQRSRSMEGGGGGSFFGVISVNANAGGSSSSQSKVQKEDVLKLLKERHNHVEWTGEKFEIKPMVLYRLNLAMLNTSSTIATANIQVRRYETVHSIKLRLTDTPANQTPSLTPQLVEARLNAKLAEAKTALQNAEARLRSERNTRITNAENALKARLNSVEQRIGAIPSWPRNNLCILANGNCPPGFSRQDGHLRAINQYAANVNYVKAMNFGSSSIRCHGRCGQYGNWIGELNLVVCCK